MLTRLSIIFFISLFFLLPGISFASEGDFIWNQLHDFGNRSDNAYSVAVDLTGIYVVGIYNNNGNNQWKIEKREKVKGDLIWIQTVIPGLGVNKPLDVAVDSSGLYVTGYSDLGGSNYQWRTEKRSLVDGSLIWVQPRDLSTGLGNDIAEGIVVDSSGVYVAGWRGGALGNQWGVEKYSLSDGTLIWSQTGVSGYATEIAVDPSGIYVVGASPNGGNNEWRTEKRSLADGGLIWGHTNDPSIDNDVPYGIVSDTSGIYIVGVDNGWRIEKRSLIDGSLVWTQTNSAGWSAYGASIDSSGVYVVGSYYVSGDYRWQIEKRSLPDGNLIWSRTSNPTTGAEEAFNVAVDSSGIYVVGNQAIVATPGDQQWRIEKRSRTHCIVSGSGTISSNAGVYRIQAVNGNRLNFYHNGSGSNPVVYTFTDCGMISGDVSRPVGSALYGIGDGNKISIRDASATSTIYGEITFSEGSSILGTFSGRAGAGGVMISGSGNNLLDLLGGTFIMTFDYIAPQVCTGPIPISWTDPEIIPNVTKVRKAHIDELRTWINDRRADAGLAAYSWTDPTLTANTTKIRKVHFDEMRTAIANVYNTCNSSTLAWTDPTLTANTTKIRAAHLTELRDATENTPTYTLPPSACQSGVYDSWSGTCTSFCASKNCGNAKIFGYTGTSLVGCSQCSINGAAIDGPWDSNYADCAEVGFNMYPKCAVQCRCS